MDVVVWFSLIAVVVFICYMAIRYFAYSSLNKELAGTPDYIRVKKNFDKFFFYFSKILIIVWVISLIIFLLFHGYNPKDETANMGGDKTFTESMKTEPFTPEEIEETNEYSLKEKEIKRKPEIEESQEEARKKYDEYLKESLKDIEGENK